MTQLSFTSIKAQLFTGSKRFSRVLGYHPEMQKILDLRRLRSETTASRKLEAEFLLTDDKVLTVLSGSQQPEDGFLWCGARKQLAESRCGGISEMHFLHTFKLTCKTGCLQVHSTAEWPP